MTLYKKNLGQQGEEIIAQYLKKLGYSIVCQNYISRYGEIDIIACDKKVLAFIEVKCRKDSKVYLSELINYSKQQKIIKTALVYISKNNLSHIIYRFDVALLHLIKNNIELKYIQNAFTSLDESIL